MICKDQILYSESYGLWIVERICFCHSGLDEFSGEQITGLKWFQEIQWDPSEYEKWTAEYLAKAVLLTTLLWKWRFAWYSLNFLADCRYTCSKDESRQRQKSWLKYSTRLDDFFVAARVWYFCWLIFAVGKKLFNMEGRCVIFSSYRGLKVES